MEKTPFFSMTNLYHMLLNSQSLKKKKISSLSEKLWICRISLISAKLCEQKIFDCWKKSKTTFWQSLRGKRCSFQAQKNLKSSKCWKKIMETDIKYIMDGQMLFLTDFPKEMIFRVRLNTFFLLFVRRYFFEKCSDLDNFSFLFLEWFQIHGGRVIKIFLIRTW